MNKELLDLLDNYILQKGDLYTEKFFDRKSEKHIDYKFRVLGWALLNDKMITEYEDLDQEKMFELYPEEDVKWDL